MKNKTKEQYLDEIGKLKNKILKLENLRSIVKNSSDIIFLVGKDMKIQFINKSVLDLKIKDGIGKRIIDFIPKDFQKLVYAKFQSVFKTGKLTNYQTEYQTAEGETHYFNVRLSPLKKGGKVVSVVSSSNNVTKSKMFEKELKTSMKTASDIVYSTPYGLFIYQYEKPDKLILLSGNPEAERLTGIKIDDWIGKENNEIWPEARAAGVTDAYLNVMKTGKTYETEDINYKDEKLEGAFRIRAFILPEEKLCVSFENITERKKFEAELHKHREHLEELVEERNQEIEAFANSVSHDMSGPLRAIDGFTKILLEDYTSKLDKEGKRLGAVIQQNTQKMGRLLNGLRIFVGIGQKILTYVNVDMKNMVNTMYHETTSAKERKRIKFTINDMPHVTADTNMMRQSWMHLIDNAVKFSSKREKSIISVSGKVEKNKMTYCIKDNGVGFNMKYVDKLFGLFNRLHHEREFEGHGVGLALIQRIMQRHGGEMWVEGKVDTGATFYFSLPKKGNLKKEN